MRLSITDLSRHKLPPLFDTIETTTEALYDFFSRDEHSTHPTTEETNERIKAAIHSVLFLMVVCEAYHSTNHPMLRSFFRKACGGETHEPNYMKFHLVDIDYADTLRMLQNVKTRLKLEQVDADSAEFKSIAEIDVLCDTLEAHPVIRRLEADDHFRPFITREPSRYGIYWFGGIVTLPTDVVEERRICDYLKQNYTPFIVSRDSEYRYTPDIPDEPYSILKKLVLSRKCKSGLPVRVFSNIDDGYDITLAVKTGQNVRALLNFLCRHPEIDVGITMFWDDVEINNKLQIRHKNAQEILDAFDHPDARKKLGDQACDSFDGIANDVRFDVHVTFSPLLHNYLKLSNVTCDLVVDNILNLELLKNLEEKLL